MTPQELKNSILQLAVQGKLVEQRAEEGTAEELYKKIQEEKQKLIAEKKIKKEKPLPEITAEEIPFDIPESWKWVRLGEIATLYNGRAYKQNELLDKGKYPVLRVGNLFTNNHWYYSDLELESEKYCKNGDLLYSWSASFGPHIWNGDKVIYHYHIWKVWHSENIDKNFLYYILLADTNRIKQSGHGLAMIHVTKAGMENKLFPLPPLEEQKRIVVKIEELLPQIDRYEKAWSKLEEFNKRFPEDMQKSILQYAVQGKLVEQRAEEGTAEELYKKIQAEKQKLIAEKKIKKEKPLPEITAEEIPFDIPESWKWVRLDNICYQIGDIDHKMPATVEKNGIPYISPVNFVNDGKIDFDNAKKISIDDFLNLSKKCKPEKNDIIFPRYGTIGVIRMVETDQPFIVSYSCCTIKNLHHFICPKYVFYVLQSKMIKDEINRYINKTTQPNIGLKSIKMFLFPLPPLSEQKRIVAKIEELLPLCERIR